MLRFILGVLYFFRFYFLFYLLRVILDEMFVHWLHIFMTFVSSRSVGSKMFDDWGKGVKNFSTGGVTNFGEIILLGGGEEGEGQYPITCPDEFNLPYIYL